MTGEIVSYHRSRDDLTWMLKMIKYEKLSLLNVAQVKKKTSLIDTKH